MALYIQAGQTDPATAWKRAFWRVATKPSTMQERAKNPNVEAARLLRTTRVKDEIAKQMEPLAAASRGGALRLIRELEAIAYADRRELSRVRYVNCRHCYGTNFLRQWTEAEFAQAQAAEVDNAAKRGKSPRELPVPPGGFGFIKTRVPNMECPECAGEGVRDIVLADMAELSEDAMAIYEGVQESKFGLKIVTTPKMDALRMLGQMWGITPETIKHIIVNPDDAAKAASVPALPDDPVSAAETYRKFMAGEK